MTVQPEPLRSCFSTLGCADLSFPEICELAGEFKIQGLELRGISGRMDMSRCAAEQGLTAGILRNFCRLSHTQLVVAGSSFKLVEAADQDREQLIEFCAWANDLEIPYVRVFGGGTWGKPLLEQDYARAREVLGWWRQQQAARRWQTELLLETHDAFCASEPCLRLNEGIDRPLPLIWDSHHTWRVGGESPAATWKALGPLIRHVQIKDSIDRLSARHPYTYVLPGEGEAPLREIMGLLAQEQFAGFVSLEWERHWHPYLPPLREALARLRDQEWFSRQPVGMEQ